MEKCIPLEVTNFLSSKYNSPWNELETLHKLNGTDIHWNKLCYLPAEAIFEMLTNKGYPENMVLMDMFILTAVASWRMYKQIYSFDSEMEKLLSEQETLELVIPVEVLNNLPYPCIYIDVNSKEGIDGFFVYFRSSFSTSNQKFKPVLELFFIVIKEESKFTPLSIRLEEGKTLKESIKETINLREKNAEEDISIISNAVFKESLKLLPFFMQLVLYICAENKEIEENPVQKKITKKPSDKKYIKDKFREVQKWDLGTQTGMVIRKIQKRNSSKPDKEADVNEDYIPKEGAAKRPHSRRGHWHHFWTGKRNTEERKLVLRWVAPTFIHKEVETEIVTNNMIGKEKNHDN